MSFLKTKLWKRIRVGKDDFVVTFTHLKPSLIAFTNESEKRRNRGDERGGLGRNGVGAEGEAGHGEKWSLEAESFQIMIS